MADKIVNVIHPEAEIGEGTKVWHFAHFGKSVMGKNGAVGMSSYIGDGLVIGDHVSIQNNVVMHGGMVIEDYVFLASNVCLADGPIPRVGYKNHYKKYIKTRIRRGATVGVNVCILGGVEIGECAFIGVNAYVNKDVPANAIMIGTPARQVGWMCRCGKQVDSLDDLCHKNSD